MDAILIKSGGGGVTSDDVTATKNDILKGTTTLTSESDDEIVEGTLELTGDASGENVLIDKTFYNTDAHKKLTGTMPNNGAVSSSLDCGSSYTIPAGYHNGSGKITTNSLSSQTSATATAAQILKDKTAWVNGSKITGTMTDNGAKTSSLNCGGSYTIPSGYHNGSGKITANSLASQTTVDSGKTAAAAAQILTGYQAWVNGNKITGSIANQGAKTSSLNCGDSYTIPAGYHNGSGKITANSLSSQTDATAVAGNILSGKTAWVKGSKITGTLAVTSAISFSAAALSYDKIRISWTNPSKGPWQGVFIQMSTSGYPGTGGGSRVYTGTGNSTTAGGSNYVDITGLSAETTYYFTCCSYLNNVGWGSSYNVSAKTGVSMQSFANGATELTDDLWQYWFYSSTKARTMYATLLISNNTLTFYPTTLESFGDRMTTFASIEGLNIQGLTYDNPNSTRKVDSTKQADLLTYTAKLYLVSSGQLLKTWESGEWSFYRNYYFSYSYVSIKLPGLDNAMISVGGCSYGSSAKKFRLEFVK